MNKFFDFTPLTEEQFLEYIDTIQEEGYYRRANWSVVFERSEQFQRGQIIEIFKKRKQEAIGYWKNKQMES